MSERDDNLARVMSNAGAAADAELGDAEIGNTRAPCPLVDGFTLRLEHRSRYTAMARYSKREWVPAKDFIFLIGEKRELSVRVAEPEGASAKWEVTPIELRSGTLEARTGTGNEFHYVPAVTQAQRPITGSRERNKPVAYRIKATVTHEGVTQEKTEVVTQDERDIIRQEYVDFRTWYGTTLHVPYRNRIVPPKYPDIPKFRGNYDLVVDSAMSELIETTEGLLGSKIRPSSGWRNPRRNRAAKGVVNSNHQHGGAVDMQPEGTAKGSKGRRPAMVKLYHAAMKVEGTAEVILENMSKKLYTKNGAMPKPSAEDPDKDGDGLPDKATFKGRKLASLFDEATHVHVARAAPKEAEDD